MPPDTTAPGQRTGRAFGTFATLLTTEAAALEQAHALLTAESIERRGLRLRGWVANAIDPKFERPTENISSLESRISAPCLGIFSFEPQADPGTLAQALAVNALIT